MKGTLKVGETFAFSYPITDARTVPALFPDAPEFQVMPDVLATGYMVGLLEWTCVQLLNPHLDDGEGSLGVHVDFSHVAATPPGLTVDVKAECTSIDGNRIGFRVQAHDNRDLISEGSHERFVVDWKKFNAKVAEKAAAVSPAAMQANHNTGMSR